MDRSRPMVHTLVVVGAGLALLAACSGGGGGSASSTTVSASTAFSTIPIATTTTASAATGQGGGGPTDSTGGGGAAAGSASYTVVSGDYLLGIAKKLGVPLQSLLDANGMNANSLITPGQKLKIPAATTGSSTATTAAGGSGSTASSTASTAAATTTTTVADAPGTYTVRPNDGWSVIAARLGVNAADLAAFNDLTLNSVLVPGQKLRVPPTWATTTTAKA